MVRGITKAIAYYKAPRQTFALLHPVKAIKLGALVLAGRMILGKRDRR